MQYAASIANSAAAVDHESRHHASRCQALRVPCFSADRRISMPRPARRTNPPQESENERPWMTRPRNSRSRRNSRANLPMTWNCNHRPMARVTRPAAAPAAVVDLRPHARSGDEQLFRPMVVLAAADLLVADPRRGHAVLLLHGAVRLWSVGLRIIWLRIPGPGRTAPWRRIVAAWLAASRNGQLRRTAALALEPGAGRAVDGRANSR